jgi:4-amino-4-deoxy-L-arabinose transferase-like glycosyltransferase
MSVPDNAKSAPVGDLPRGAVDGRFATRSTFLHLLAAVFAVCVYLYGLDSDHIPKNGDEGVYIQITRVTASSGHWLPLRTEIEGTRNIKPPLLFWQGIASTNSGRAWSRWRLRLPNVLYTLLTATMVGLLTARAGGQAAFGLAAATVYLSFFDTYRYGRPFLTNAPETFWLFLDWFVLVMWERAALRSWWLPLLLGVTTGVGLLYKSFALIVPVGVAVAGAYLRARHYDVGAFVRRDAWKPVALSLLALACFALWFVLDPQPQAIWQDFVLKENAAKFTSDGQAYLGRLVWGGSSLWTILFAAPVNAGLLFFPVLALMVGAWRHREQLSATERALWLWVLVMTVFYALPSQRSIRYLLTAMPAVAALLVLGWHRVSRGWFVASLAVGSVGEAFVLTESSLLERGSPVALFPIGFWFLITSVLVFNLACIARSELTRPGAAIAALGLYASIAMFLTPFDGPLGHFDAAALRATQGQTVHVPSALGADESYRFLLPAARILSYDETARESAAALATRYRLFTVRLPIGATVCADCRVLGSRLDLRGRLSPADGRQMLAGKVLDTLILREWLVASTAASARD